MVGDGSGGIMFSGERLCILLIIVHGTRYLYITETFPIFGGKLPTWVGGGSRVCREGEGQKGGGGRGRGRGRERGRQQLSGTMDEYILPETGQCLTCTLWAKFDIRKCLPFEMKTINVLRITQDWVNHSIIFPNTTPVCYGITHGRVLSGKL